MTLSRTARILIALLLVAAAAFFWVNFFNQPQSPAPLLAQPATVPATAGATAPGTAPAAASGPGAAAADAANGSPTALAEGAVAQADGASPEGAASDGAASGAAPTAVPQAPAVVTPPTVVLRDLVVDDLPFLVTSPPVAAAEPEAAEGNGATRPQTSQRGNINPFSPVVVQAPPAQTQQVFAEEPSQPSAEPDVVVVNTGGQPASSNGASSAPATVTAQAPVQAPAPRAVAPAPARVSALPRPLPSGTLPTTPDILRDARTAPSTPSGPDNLAEVAAVRVPNESTPAALPPVTAQTTAEAPAGPAVLGPGQPSAESVKSSASSGLPLVVGADPLSRYLRDNDVRFTGTALGPLSVGVFRAKQFDKPVVLTLGQTLPDTEIVLADLRGYEAKFSLGDNTQVLSLDIRR